MHRQEQLGSQERKDFLRRALSDSGGDVNDFIN